LDASAPPECASPRIGDTKHSGVLGAIADDHQFGSEENKEGEHRDHQPPHRFEIETNANLRTSISKRWCVFVDAARIVATMLIISVISGFLAAALTSMAL
jgi:hypothetical protein